MVGYLYVVTAKNSKFQDDFSSDSHSPHVIPRNYPEIGFSPRNRRGQHAIKAIAL